MANPEKRITLKILYFNMELPVQNVIAKYVARKAFDESSGRIRLDVNKIFQKGSRVSPDMERIIDRYKNSYDELLDYVTFYEGSITWRYMYKEIMNTLRTVGKFTTIVDPITKEEYKNYEYYNPDTYIICIADHIGLLKGGKNPDDKKTDKGIMDDLINNCVIPSRNKYSITWALCQQMNRANEDPNRMRSAAGSEPLLGDFMGSSIPAQGADTVIGLYRPQWFGLKNYMGYNVDMYRDFFLSAKLLKNRDGRMGVVDTFGFLGSVGYLKELPYAEKIGTQGFPSDIQIMNKFKEV
jgi:hypothetical protein